MKTDDLIHILSCDGACKGPKPLAFVCFACLLVFTALTFFVLGFRAELIEMHPTIGFFAKTALFGGIALWAAYALTQAAKPIGKPIHVKLAAACLVVLFAGALAYEWLRVPAEVILRPFENDTFPTCLVTVSAYGIIGTGILLGYLKRFAPGNIRHAALLTGFCAVSFAALGYSFHCSADGPTYIAVAYGLPALALVFLASVIAPRFLRW
ncbi:MAG: NrsF family protein [Pseudobdellovibrionaceae bacterium]